MSTIGSIESIGAEAHVAVVYGVNAGSTVETRVVGAGLLG